MASNDLKLGLPGILNQDNARLGDRNVFVIANHYSKPSPIHVDLFTIYKSSSTKTQHLIRTRNLFPGMEKKKKHPVWTGKGSRKALMRSSVAFSRPTFTDTLRFLLCTHRNGQLTRAPFPLYGKHISKGFSSLIKQEPDINFSSLRSSKKGFIKCNSLPFLTRPNCFQFLPTKRTSARVNDLFHAVVCCTATCTILFPAVKKTPNWHSIIFTWSFSYRSFRVICFSPHVIWNYLDNDLFGKMSCIKVADY